MDHYEILKICQDAITKIIAYYEGNEYNELVMEPLMIKAAIQQQIGLY